MGIDVIFHSICTKSNNAWYFLNKDKMRNKPPSLQVYYLLDKTETLFNAVKTRGLPEIVETSEKNARATSGALN